jgi:hypothetical protein
MKQAIIITAYKDFEQLIDLIKIFDEDFNIYIHIDKKSKLNQTIIKEISEISNVRYLTRRYRVNWGGLNHLKAILLLSEKALLDSENQLFHLITGQDFPIKNKNYFKNLLDNSKQIPNYLEFFKMPATFWKNGGMDRLEQYNFYDLFNVKSPLGKKCILFIKNIQHKFNLKRNMNHSKQFYGGSTYWTLNKDVLKYVIDFTNQNHLFFKRFRFTFCAEEIYFQTIIMNSEFANCIINDNLRFIDWKTGRGGSPAFLDENDYEQLLASDKLFARKIDSKKNKLKQMLTHSISNSSEGAKNQNSPSSQTS